MFQFTSSGLVIEVAYACAQPSDQPVSAKDNYWPSGCAERRTEESQEDRVSFGCVLLDIDGFSQLVCARSCALELKCTNWWPSLVAGFAAHHHMESTDSAWNLAEYMGECKDL